MEKQHIAHWVGSGIIVAAIFLFVPIGSAIAVPCSIAPQINAVPWSNHSGQVTGTIVQGLLLAEDAQVSGCVAPLASPVFTGFVTAPAFAITGGGSLPSTPGSLTANNLLIGGPLSSQFQDSSAITTTPGFANLPAGLSISPLAASTQFALQTVQSAPLSGATSLRAINTLTFSGEALDASANGSLDKWAFYDTYGGANLQGARQSLFVQSIFNGPSNIANTNRNYVAAVFRQEIFVGDNGTDTGSGARGAVFAVNPICEAHSNVTNLGALICGEVDVVSVSGATMKRRRGWSVVSQGIATGVLEDSAYQIGVQTGMSGFGTGFLFSHANGAAPLQTAGCAICTDGTADTIATGLDLSPYTISGNFLNGPGGIFGVTGAGAATALNLNVSGAAVPANGMYLQSSVSQTLGFSANSTAIMFLNGSTITLSIGGPGGVNTGDYLAIRANQNSSASTTIRNISASSAAQTALYLGTSNGNTQTEMITNGGAFSGGNGANAFTLANNGPIFIQGNQTQGLAVGLEVDGSGNDFLPSVAGGTPASSLCLDSSNKIIKKSSAGSCI